MSETQTLTIQGFLIFIIAVCLVYLVSYGAAHIWTKRRNEKYATDHFKKIEEYRNELD